MNATVTIQCNKADVYSTTFLVEYAHRPTNITGSVIVSQNKQCNIGIVFNNANGSSEPFVLLFGECSVNATEVFLVNIYRYNS